MQTLLIDFVGPFFWCKRTQCAIFCEKCERKQFPGGSMPFQRKYFFLEQEAFIHNYIWLLSLHLTSNSTYDLNLFCCTITILFFTRNFTYWSGLNHCCNILPAQPTSVSDCKEVIRLIKSRPYRRSNARPAWTGSIELTYIAFFKTLFTWLQNMWLGLKNLGTKNTVLNVKGIP